MTIPDVPISDRKRYIPVFAGAFLLYYMIMMLISPVRTINSLDREYGFRQNEKNIINDSIVTDSTYLSLYRERAFLQARIDMAASDSLCLSLNLPDSSANLDIVGVTVNSTKISGMKVSKILKDRQSYAITSMLSKPLTIENAFSSIPREPLMIKMAPRDTSEYKPDIIPDTADYEPVNFILELKEGIVIYFYQDERLNPFDGLRCFFFDLGYRFVRTWRDLKNVVILKVPEYNPYIKIRLPREDAKILYRALPEKGQVALLR
ncbi:MAG TPA: hypothetical protein P5180_02855 [Bacteroidales bacterium]|nr:hypothetical protein [Bacteroidales bacterium]HRW84347.1 hypothetical protein [Bacteroidales bacterium]